MNLRVSASIVCLGLVLAACAEGSPGGGGGTTPSPTPAPRADDLVLRWGYQGGFTPPLHQLTNPPQFSLYADGTIVRPGPQIEIYPPPALPAVERFRVDEAGLRAIVDAALAANLDTVRDLTDMGSVGIADAPETVFTFRHDGVDRTVRVYALSEVGGQPPGMSDEEYRAREDLMRLIDRLQSLERWLPEGSVGPSEVYEPEGVRIYVSRYRGEPELEQPEVPWPLAMPLATIGDDTELGYRCTVITGEDWETLRPAAGSANQLTPWTSDGKRYAVAFVPLLPDAEGC